MTHRKRNTRNPRNFRNPQSQESSKICVAECEVEVLVLHYLQERQASFPETLAAFEKEKQARQLKFDLHFGSPNVIPNRSLVEILNEYATLKLDFIRRQSFVSLGDKGGGGVPQVIEQTINALFLLLEDYKAIRAPFSSFSFSSSSSSSSFCSAPSFASSSAHSLSPSPGVGLVPPTPSRDSRTMPLPLPLSVPVPVPPSSAFSAPLLTPPPIQNGTIQNGKGGKRRVKEGSEKEKAKIQKKRAKTKQAKQAKQGKQAKQAKQAKLSRQMRRVTESLCVPPFPERVAEIINSKAIPPLTVTQTSCVSPVPAPDLETAMDSAALDALLDSVVEDPAVMACLDLALQEAV